MTHNSEIGRMGQYGDRRILSIHFKICISVLILYSKIPIPLCKMANSTCFSGWHKIGKSRKREA